MAGWRGERIYRLREWKRLRHAALQRAGWRCEERLDDGSRCRRWGGEVHHVVPLVAGGAALPGLDGVVALCFACHSKRHGRRVDPDRARWRDLLARI